MKHWATTKIPGVIAALFVLSLGVCCAQQARQEQLTSDDGDYHAGSSSTLRAQNLLVDNNASMATNGSGQIVMGTNTPIPSTTLSVDGGYASQTTQVWFDLSDTAHTAGENINLVTRNHETFDTTAGAATAGGLDIGCSATRAAGANPLTNQCVLINASSADVNVALVVNTGASNFNDQVNLNAATVGDASATLTWNGTSVLGNSSHDSSTGRDMTIARTLFVGPTGVGAGHVESGVLGSATRPVGSDLAGIESYGGNGNNVFLTLNNTLAGQKGWAFYNATNGASSDWKFFNYNLGADALIVRGATSFHEFQAGISATTITTGGVSGSKWSRGTGVPGISCAVGDLFSRTDGSTSTTLYVCTAANTWTAK